MPRTLGRIWRAYLRGARRIGELVTWVVLGLAYWVVVPPFVPFGRRGDPLLRRRRDRPGYWRPLPPAPADLEPYRHPF